MNTNRGGQSHFQDHDKLRPDTNLDSGHSISTQQPQYQTNRRTTPPSSTQYNEQNDARAAARSMNISGLISPEYDTESRFSDRRSPSGLSSSSSDSRRHAYRMEMRQQPINARACGFGERDRRVIDPPPILELVADRSGQNITAHTGELEHPYCVVHCTIWHADKDEEDVIILDSGSRRQQRRLMGTSVSNAFLGKDENDVEGCFFTFPDLSCRTAGRYRLRFILVFIEPASTGVGARAPFQSVVISDVFTVYAAKDFPGMRPSTALTSKLKDQGCLISVKKGKDSGKETSRITLVHRSEEENTDNEEESNDESTEQGADDHEDDDNKSDDESDDRDMRGAQQASHSRRLLPVEEPRTAAKRKGRHTDPSPPRRGQRNKQ